MDQVRVTKLVRDLQRPIFVHQMALGLKDHPDARQKAGVEKRLHSSSREIDRIVREYANEE